MNHKGFTLIELVMVLVLIGIVAVFVAPKLGEVTGTKAGSFKDKLRADIRYAQSLAMTQNRRYRVYCNTTPAPTPNGYAVVYDTSGGAWTSYGYAQDFSGTGNLSLTLDAGQYTGITVSTPAGGFIEFDSSGTPTVGGGVVITVFANGVAAGTMTITAQTGAVN